MSDAEEQASEVLYRLQELNDWALDDKAALGIITAALQARERAVWLEASEVAANHECGGEDDIICQHQNCAMLIEAKCRQHAQEVNP